MEQDEIYLADLWRLLQRQWRWFASAFVLVIALAAIFLALAKPQWEATAWIRIGQVGAVPLSEDAHAEPFQRVLDRMNRRPFQDAVLIDLGIDPKSRDAALYRHSFQVYPSPYAGLIKIIVHGQSPGQAQQFATATCNHLEAIHDALEAAPRQFAKARLEQTQAQLAEAIDEQTSLRRMLSDSRSATDSKFDVAAASVALVDIGHEIHRLQQAAADLATRLSPTYTFATSMAWPVYVSDRPVSPNPVLMLGLALAAALGAGLLMALVRDARRRDRPAPREPNAEYPAPTS